MFPSINPSVDKEYDVAKWGVLREETWSERVEGVGNERSASDVAVSEE